MSYVPSSTLERHMPEATPDFSAISPTALLIAWLRAHTDLPFARAVAEATGAAEVAARLLADSGAPLDEHLQNAPFAEARYRSVGAAIGRLGLRQVLELGAGLAFRGPDFARDSDVVYLDTDLPGLQAVKRRLLATVPALRDPGGRVEYLDCDATRWEDVEAAARGLRADRPVAVVNEGLLGYLDLEEKARVADNVRRLLERLGGAWITPDLATREDYARHHAAFPRTSGAHAAIGRKTGRDLEERAFDDDAHVRRFFAERGLAAEARPQLDGSFVVGERAGVPLERLVAAGPRVWVLTPAVGRLHAPT